MIMMITKEQFLDNTTIEEVFSLIHEFKEKYNQLMKEDNLNTFNPLDKDISLILHNSIEDEIYLEEQVRALND